VPTPGRVSTLEAPARALRQTVGAGRDNRRVNETQNQEQQTAPAAEQRDVAEKSMAALLASDANQAVVGLAVVGAAAGAKKIVDKLRGPGDGGGQDGGTKPKPPAND
jgi:hypothetical protein